MMRVSVKEFEDNFDIFLDMVEKRTVDMIIIEDENDSARNIVLVPCSYIDNMLEGQPIEQVGSDTGEEKS